MIKWVQPESALKYQDCATTGDGRQRTSGVDQAVRQTLEMRSSSQTQGG